MEFLLIVVGLIIAFALGSIYGKSAVETAEADLGKVETAVKGHLSANVTDDIAKLKASLKPAPHI
jgi:hypothetical protein